MRETAPKCTPVKPKQSFACGFPACCCSKVAGTLIHFEPPSRLPRLAEPGTFQPHFVSALPVSPQQRRTMRLGFL